MQPDERLIYQQLRLVDPEWYEPFDRYHPSDELLRAVRAIIPPTWRLRRSSIWFHVSPTEVKRPQQGWKIHISAIPANCEDVLCKAAVICVQRETPFKFALDQRIVDLMTSKGWSRPASGKFITIYPLNDQHFLEIIEALYAALDGLVGPYVLSDRRYKDAHTIYYRYGGIEEFTVVSVGGDRQYMLVTPDGELTPDVRAPYWNPPAWVSDPFELTDNEESDPTLKDGRYYVEQPLGFSVTGGVYMATDSDSGSSVVIKEARPATGVDMNGRDAVDRLRKEYRLLQRLQGTGITPAPIDLFEDWEHLFLVEEYIPGLDLGHFTIGFNPLIAKIHPDVRTIEAYVALLQKIWINLALGIAAIHDRGIICGDLSIKNVVVRNAELGDVRIIDLEAAWEDGVDAPTQLMTPGFSSPTRRGAPSKEDDRYALGAVMLGTLFPMNNLLDLEPSAKEVFIEALGGDLGLPEQAQHVIEKCMSNVASERPTPRQVAEIIRHVPAQCATAPVSTPPSREELLEIVSDIADYICVSADLDREDRLYPADPFVFLTNPLSVAHGAVGVAYALSRIEGEVSKLIRSWILSRPINPDQYPPGLYLGSAGIAWGLWELGLEEVALQTLRATDNHALLWDLADVFYGAAGYGLTCLRLHQGTGDQALLDRAVQVGDWLAHSRISDVRGCHWPDKEGRSWLGYARGASGIALFLLYLHLATGEERFLKLGEEALAFDLTHALTTEEGYLSIPRGTVGSFENVLTHYWLDGSAGVATVLVRFWAYTKNTEYLDTLKRLAQDTFRKYTVFPGLFRGLSGLGNFLLDAYEFTGEECYLHEAYRTASGIALFKIRRSGGLAFPGEQLYRISTDFGTGSAGIGLFLHRLAHAGQQVGNFNFTLDHLLQGYSVGTTG